VKNSLSTDHISFLSRLRTGDRVAYGGKQWRVEDFSTYDDANGYEMMEWLLHSHSSNYYLLREIDPDSIGTRVNWYISEEISVDRICGEHVGDDIRFELWDAMHNQHEPYPKLRAMGRVYYFESKTEGTYTSEVNHESRTTWDYWDEDHLWNLAIEAWQNQELHVYSTKTVDAEEFEMTEKSIVPQKLTAASPNYIKNSESDRTWQWVCAWGLVIVGFILMISGDW
jgi:hypothetical protein